MTTPILSVPVRGKGRHYRWPGTDTFVPSVTNVLSILDKPALPRWASSETAKAAAAIKHDLAGMDDDEIVSHLKGAPWRKSEKASERGTTIHQWLENAMLGKELPELDGEAADYEQAADRWLHDMQPTPVRLEVTMFATDYAGTADGVVEIDGSRWLIDFKTSKGLYESAALQVAALAACPMWSSEDFESAEPCPPVDRVAAVRIGADGDYEMLEVIDLAGLQAAFRSCLEVWKWKYEGAKPFGPKFERTRDE
ncbi:MAG: hypothetical protein RLY50_32 [Actinomycetota bacterium]